MGNTRKTFTRLTKAAIAAAALGLATVPASAKSLTGIWLDDKGRGAIEILPCGSKYCGRVVWTRSAADSRRGCGKQLIGGVAKLGTDSYGGGWIYSPERRKTFDVELRPLENGNLRVTGYAGIRLFSKTMIWTPAPEDIERCDKTPASSNEPITAEKTAPSPDNRTAEKPVKSETETAKADVDNADVEETRETSPVVSENRPEVVNDGALPRQQETAKSETTEPVDQPETSDDVAESDEEQRQDDEPEIASMEDTGPPAPREKGLDLDKFGLGDVLKRTSSGRCKLDLPWVKVQFECEE